MVADTLHPFHLDLYLSHQIPLPFPQMVLDDCRNH